MLLQGNDKNYLKLVYTISRRVSEVESRYHSSKLELVAIYWATTKRLRSFLIPLKFTIVTDCQALVFLNTSRTKYPQVAQWAISLCDYNFTIRHRKGEQIAHVDALSRASFFDDNTQDVEIPEVLTISTTREDEILLHQRTDEKLNRLIKILEKLEEERLKDERGAVRDFRLEGGWAKPPD